MSNLTKYSSGLRSFFEENAKTVLKQPNSCLKYPFVDPGSVYDGNLWDWDSFWAVYALFSLVNTSGDHKLGELVVEHAKGNIRNFFDHQLEDGYIPMMIEESDLPEPYLIMKHKEGVILNMMKPFLCHQIALISGFCNDFDWFCGYVANMERYFACCRSVLLQR